MKGSDNNLQIVDFDNKSSLRICSICKQKKATSAFTATQRRTKNPCNIKCKSCVQKLKLSPNYI